MPLDNFNKKLADQRNGALDILIFLNERKADDKGYTVEEISEAKGLNVVLVRTFLESPYHRDLMERLKLVEWVCEDSVCYYHAGSAL